MAISKFQTFTPKTINRQQIQNAPYNPRKIGDKEAKALRLSIKTHGLVETLVWNIRTGNLVSGHQRLAQIDFLEKKTDYDLTVAQIDVDLKREKELNLALNNPNLQGEYDFDAVAKLMEGLDLVATGFTDQDLSIWGVDADIDNMEENEAAADAKNNIEAIKAKNIEEAKENKGKSIEEIKAAKAASREKNVSQGEAYIIVTFSSVEAKESFMDAFGAETDDRYLKGEVLYKQMFGDEESSEDAE